MKAKNYFYAICYSSYEERLYVAIIFREDTKKMLYLPPPRPLYIFLSITNLRRKLYRFLRVTFEMLSSLTFFFFNQRKKMAKTNFFRGLRLYRPLPRSFVFMDGVTRIDSGFP